MGLCCSSEKPVGKPLGVLCRHRFQQPIHPYGSVVNGVRFFELIPEYGPVQVSEPMSVYASPGGALGSHGQQQHEWLGKEYSQAFDELEFYDMACHLRDEDENGQWRVFNFLPSFHGLLPNATLALPSTVAGETGVRYRSADLVVFRSPLEGLVRPRLLSLAVGPQSNALQYRKSSDLDSVLFARQHGVTVEGMMSPPKSVMAEDPGFDAKGWAWGNSQETRAKRIDLQCRGLSEVLTALVDFRDTVIEEELHDTPCAAASSDDLPRKMISKSSTSSLDTLFLGASEFSEIALQCVVHELASLLHATIDVPVPQKWVGSSVALITEAGMAPPRLGPVDPKNWVSSRVRVRLLGWNRSQVTQPTTRLTIEEEADNRVMWQIYLDSLGCMLWEASRLYMNAFCTEEWQSLSFAVYECHPSSDKRVLLGTGELPLTKELAEDEDFDPQTVSLAVPADTAGGQVSSAELVVHARFGEYHPSSRLRGAWYVRVAHAKGLPAPDAQDSPLEMTGREVFVVVTAKAYVAAPHEGARHFSQRTARHGNRSEPAWNEELHFPVTADGAQAAERLVHTLGCGRPEDSFAGDEAAGNPADGVHSLVKHFLDPEAKPSPAESDEGQGAAATMALRQMAFMMEVRAGWLDAIQPVFPPPR